MLAANMICIVCGCRGSIDEQEVSIEPSRQDGFKYLGHDAFTGAMHYQCPECNSYLNVDPMDMFKTYPVKGQPGPGNPEKDTYRVSADNVSLWQLAGVIKDGVFGLTRYIIKNIGPNL